MFNPTLWKYRNPSPRLRRYKPKDYTVSSQTLPSLISSEKPDKLTNPFHMPMTDVFEDLWMRNQITPSYLARASVSGLLVAYGLIQNDIITLAAAFLFTPFLAQVLAAGFGLIAREWRLAAQGGLTLAISTVITVLAGVVVAVLTGGPLQYDNFSPLLVNS